MTPAQLERQSKAGREVKGMDIIAFGQALETAMQSPHRLAPGKVAQLAADFLHYIGEPLTMENRLVAMKSVTDLWEQEHDTSTA